MLDSRPAAAAVLPVLGHGPAVVCLDSLITIWCAVLCCCLLPAAYTNPADHFMDLITVKNPITSEPSCPPVSHTDLLPDPAELRAYYKNVQVGSSTSCIRLLCAQGCAVLYAGG